MFQGDNITKPLRGPCELSTDAMFVLRSQSLDIERKDCGPQNVVLLDSSSGRLLLYLGTCFYRKMRVTGLLSCLMADRDERRSMF